MILTFWDWLIVIVFIAILTGVAWWTKRYVRGVADFVVAGRKMRKYLGLTTDSAQGYDIASIASGAEQGFLHGFAFIWLSLLNAAIIIPIYGIFGFGIKRFRATKCMTLPEFYEMRYTKSIRLLMGIIMVIGGILNMAIFPIVGCKYLQLFLNIPDYMHVLGVAIPIVPVMMFILLSLAVFFAVVGGQVTVMLTDFIQAIVLAVFLFIVAFIIIGKLKLTGIHETLVTNIGDAAFNPFKAQSYGWRFIVYFAMSVFFLRLSFAPSVQKLQSADSPKTARQMIMLGYIFGRGREFSLLLWGIGALAIVGVTATGGLSSAEYPKYATALMLKQMLPAGIVGLAFASLLFAFITTQDSYLLAWASILSNDVICVIRKKPFSQKGHLNLIRAMVVVIAVILFLYGLIYKGAQSLFEYMLITGTIMTGGGIIVMFGLYWKKTTNAAAYFAVLSCLIVPLLHVLLLETPLGDLFSYITGMQYAIEPQDAGLIATGLALVGLIVISLLSKKPGTTLDFGKMLKDEEQAAAKKGQAS